MAQSFLFTGKIITKYFSERFLSICGQKRPLKVLYIATDNRSDQLLQILQTRIKSRIIKNYLGMKPEETSQDAAPKKPWREARIAWAFKPSFASSNVKSENDNILNWISDEFDKRRISEPKTQ